eukprot:7367515-Prymnesium_polylepis.2
MCILLHVARGAGTEFVIENPADRGCRERADLHLADEYGPLWLMPDIQTLARVCGCLSATFAQCMFGAEAQKYTTFLILQACTPAAVVGDAVMPAWP